MIRTRSEVIDSTLSQSPRRSRPYAADRPSRKRSFLFIGATFPSLIFISVASLANPATRAGVQEGEAVAAFLQSGVADWKPATFCINTTLAGVDHESIGRLSLLPGMSGKSSQAQSYLNDLKFVSEETAARPTASMAVDSLKTVAFKARAGTYRECTELPTYRFNRTLISKNRAVVSGRFATKCATIPFGANLRSRNGKWAAEYVAYYPSVVRA